MPLNRLVCNHCGFQTDDVELMHLHNCARTKEDDYKIIG